MSSASRIGRRRPISRCKCRPGIGRSSLISRRLDPGRRRASTNRPMAKGHGADGRRQTGTRELGLDGRRRCDVRAHPVAVGVRVVVGVFPAADPVISAPRLQLEMVLHDSGEPKIRRRVLAQPASRGHRHAVRSGHRRAGRAVPGSLSLPGARGARQPAASAHPRSGNRARHGALPAPRRSNNPDLAPGDRLHGRPCGRAHPDRHSLERAPRDGEPRRVRSQHRRGSAKSRRHAAREHSFASRCR